MTDKPIIFSGPMVRAIIDGRKTMTRRVLKPQPDPTLPAAGCELVEGKWCLLSGWDGSICGIVNVPYAIGDRLWAREGCLFTPALITPDGEDGMTAYHPSVWYRADGDCPRQNDYTFSRSSRHMPKWASRLTLIVEGVKVERLHDISEEDAKAEGAHRRGRIGDDPMHPEWTMTGDGWRNDTPLGAFKFFWDSINAKRGYGWSENPWVVAVSFRPVAANIDRMEDE